MIKDIIEKNESVTANDKEMAVLKENFTSCFDKDGKFDIVKFQETIKDKVDVTKEGYELNFLGKSYAKLLASIDTTTVIKPDVEHNSKPENAKSENIYISGDNLDALKHLAKSYAGLVKCIYIDPPYNTGSDGFVYNDKFEFTVSDLVQKLSISEDEAARILDLTKRGSASHSAWLTFMYPRLLLARDMLKEDGVIFISIDDNESADLIQLCNYVFGEENCVERFYIQVRYGEKSLNEKDDFQKLIEQVLVFSKNKSLFKPQKSYEDYDLSKFEWNITTKEPNQTLILGGKKVEIYHKDQYEIKKVTFSTSALKETWASGSVLKGNTSGKFFDKQLSTRVSIDGLGCLYKVFGIGEDGLGYRFFTGPKKVGATKGKFYSGVPTTRLSELSKGESKKYLPILNYYDFSADFGNISKEGGIAYNSGKKPIKMIKQFLSYLSDEDSIVLDFFGGSSSTAHAVLSYNIENLEKHFKYILVQLHEKCDKESDAYKVYHFNYIDELGMARIRNVQKEFESEGFAGDIDYGFKHFTLVEPSATTIDKIESFEQNSIVSDNDILKEFGKETVLATWLNDDGYGLTTAPHEIDLAGYKAYFIGKHLYLLDNDFNNEAQKALFEKYNNEPEFNPENIVLFGYSFSKWTILEGLKTNLRQLQNKKINFDIRY